MLDDHAVILGSISPMLAKEPDIEHVECVGTYEEGIRAIAEHRYDVAVLDIELPEQSGLEFARACVEKQPECKVVFLTGNLDRKNVEEAMRLRANGYLLKTIDTRDLVSSLRLVSRGIDVYHDSVSNLLQVASLEVVAANEPDALLSPQQLRVLRNVAKGMTNKQIARHMDISEKTARNYLASVFEKLGVQRRAEAAVWYSQNLGEPESSADQS
ncbi:MAG: response regulator [Gammaproteobacteria bacterium]